MPVAWLLSRKNTIDTFRDETLVATRTHGIANVLLVFRVQCCHARFV